MKKWWQQLTSTAVKHDWLVDVMFTYGPHPRSITVVCEVSATDAKGAVQAALDWVVGGSHAPEPGWREVRFRVQRLQRANKKVVDGLRYLATLRAQRTETDS